MDTEGNKIKYLDAEELTTLARRYYATRNPNPDRLGCPPSDEINNVVRQRQAPNQALREHLFKCSECFGEYHQALAQCRRPEPEKSAWSDRLVSIVASKLSATATTTAVLILSSLSFIERLIARKPAPEADKAPVARSTSSGDKVAPMKIGLIMIVWIRRVISGIERLVPSGAWRLRA